MLVARLTVSALKIQAVQTSKSVSLQSARHFRNVGNFKPISKSRIPEKVLKVPQTAWKSMEVGQIFAAGAGVAGMGMLCYYGLGLSSQPGSIETMQLWPEYVRQRIKHTYGYFGASVAGVAGMAVAFYRSPMSIKFSQICSRHPILSTVGIFAALIGTGTAMMSIPYEPGFGPKQMMWLTNLGVLGMAVSPICMLGGALAIRAAWYTAGVCGGLSAIALCAPSEKFLTWAGPLSMGLGVVVVASLGSVFLPPTSAFGMGLYSISLYGGLVLFSGFLLYDTQKIIQKAQSHPTYSVTRYDPINASHRIVMDTLNIFVRIVQILAMGGNRKK